MIADRYQPIEQIGTGGMATVWRARDTLLGRLVAIKRLLPHLANDPEAAGRFKREAQAAASLSHPGIVTVFDSGEDDEGPFIVLELIEGATLANHLAASGPLDPATVADIVSQVGSALDHAHAIGVIHRDIKPANLILEPEGRVRLADFGIARTVDDPATITASGELVGTITYLAPEILAGQPATPASDIYSLGAVTYELLAGRPPYTAESPAALLDAVRRARPPSLHGIAPDQMAAAVSAAMAREPASRPTTAGALAAALVGSATLVLEPGTRFGAEMSTHRSTSPRQNDQPTVVTGALTTPPGAAEPEPSGRARWSLFAVLLGVLALAAAAMTTDRFPGATTDPGATPLAATSTTSPPSTMSTHPTTTTSPSTTTTTIPTTVTTAITAEGVAGEIGSLLALLQPPEFKPKEVRQVEDRLEQVMAEWQEDDREDLIRELERAFDEVADLEESREREELTALLIRLAELMGFEVERSGQDGDDGGDG